MIRRLSGIVAGLIVVTFSFSGWTNVCVGMTQRAPSQSAAHGLAGHGAHDDASKSHSNHGKNTETQRCQHVSSCTGVTLAPVNRRQATHVEHADRVLLIDQLPPSSQSPDLEPPPPKA